MAPDYEDELSAALAESEIEDLADIADGEMETLVCISIGSFLMSTVLIVLERLMRHMLATNVLVMSH